METKSHFRPTKAIIHLDAIKHNVSELKKHLQSSVQIIAVVKANAYGHGDVEVSKAALAAGASILAVATADEALHIRKHFPETPILVLGASPVEFAPYAADLSIMLTVFSTEWVEQVQKISKDFKKPLNAHIKIDTGMGRIGVRSKEELLVLHNLIATSNNMVVDGVFTHFATADEEDTLYFERQVAKFDELVASLPTKPRLVHASNTAGALIKDARLQYDAVRFGISMYGLLPSGYVGGILPFPIKPAFALETELVQVKKISPGDGVGYGATFVADKETWIGTLPIGYADGMIRKLAGQEVLVGGERVPIVGRICMDQCMIALPRAYKVGEKVTLIGEQQGIVVSMEEWATKLETISYEVPCIITVRVPRIYSE